MDREAWCREQATQIADDYEATWGPIPGHTWLGITMEQALRDAMAHEAQEALKQFEAVFPPAHNILGTPRSEYWHWLQGRAAAIREGA